MLVEMSVSLEWLSHLTSSLYIPVQLFDEYHDIPLINFTWKVNLLTSSYNKTTNQDQCLYNFKPYTPSNCKIVVSNLQMT